MNLQINIPRYMKGFPARKEDPQSEHKFTLDQIHMTEVSVQDLQVSTFRSSNR